MPAKRICRKHHDTFESIRQTDADGNEFWSARELAPLLEYQDWRNFIQVVDKARVACKQSGRPPRDHFGDVTKMVSIGSGAVRSVQDLHLSRYACYLIVQNGDPNKSVIANGQTYFALQTRRQELANDKEFAQLSETEKRLAIRNELTAHNKHLAAAAKQAGVATSFDYAIFQDHGYRGLYGGFGSKEIHARKGLRKSGSQRRTKLTMKWVARFVRQSLNLVASCRRIYQGRSRVSSSSPRRRKDWRTKTKSKREPTKYSV